MTQDMHTGMERPGSMRAKAVAIATAHHIDRDSLCGFLLQVPFESSANLVIPPERAFQVNAFHGSINSGKHLFVECMPIPKKLERVLPNLNFTQVGTRNCFIQCPSRGILK
jgi:hypothetical protein